jgi:hypothetical protein
MAQKVQVLLVDDIDGGEADESVTFALDGKTYEIDLSDKNAAKLREALAVYLTAGRRVGSQRGRASSKPVRAAGEPSAEELRKWAKANGYEVSERGRVPASIKEAYAAATK